jgi:hypothetical protein
MYSAPHILIIGPGRSGTTAIQKLLCSNQRVLIRGENNNFFYGLYRSYLSITRSPTNLEISTSPSKPWFGFQNYNPSIFLRYCREIADDFIIGESSRKDYLITGFKEIRYYKYAGFYRGQSTVPATEVEGYLEFLKMVFPGAKIIHVTRNIEEILGSGWWPKVDKLDATNNISNINSTLERMPKDLVFNIDHSAINTIDHDRLSKLFSFCDLPYDMLVAESILSARLNHLQK